MAHKKKFAIEFEGMEEILEDFKRMEVDIVPVVEKALIASHKYVTPKLHERMQKKYMPSKGKYMGKRTIAREDRQIIDDINITWEGDVAKIDVGFSLDEGITPIFMIHGTESTDPVKGLKAALYGKKTQEEVSKIQEEIFFNKLFEERKNGK